MYPFQLRLHGDAARGAQLDAALLRDILDLLVRGAQGALRLRVEGRSQAAGPVPGWLRQAAEFEFVGLQEGSTILSLRSPSLSDAAPGQFAQKDLFQEIDPERSALHLLSESWSEAAAGKQDSDAYDRALLERFGAMEHIFQAGVSELELFNGGVAPLACFTPERLVKVARLASSTPQPQRARLAGRLDTIRHSDHMFVLVLEDGTHLKGSAAGLSPDEIAAYFGQTVVVEGNAEFRPSGRVQRIEAQVIETASDRDLKLWSRSPSPSFHGIPESSRSQVQGPRSGLNAIIGKWPGTESYEEFLQAVAEIS